jgi:ribonucleoside-triphosphate reductase
MKRNGTEEDFNSEKIKIAIEKANKEVPEKNRMTEEDIDRTISDIEEYIKTTNKVTSVETIQDMVEDHIWDSHKYVLGRKYSRYRYKHTEQRGMKSFYNKILTIVGRNNEEVKEENSNKNPTLNSVQRDYIAGEISKDITKNCLLPKDIWEAHEEGLIHFHDADYYVHTMHNCCLVNLFDMLMNGTVISGTKIDRPNSFLTACNVTTQIASMISSNQFGLSVYAF